MYPLVPLEIMIPRKCRRALITLMRLLGSTLLRLEHHAIEVRAIRGGRCGARGTVVRHQGHGPARIRQIVHVLRLRLLRLVVGLVMLLLLVARVVGQPAPVMAAAAVVVAAWRVATAAGAAERRYGRREIRALVARADGRADVAQHGRDARHEGAAAHGGARGRGKGGGPAERGRGPRGVGLLGVLAEGRENAVAVVAVAAGAVRARRLVDG